jgi:hypothetical protein
MVQKGPGPIRDRSRTLVPANGNTMRSLPQVFPKNVLLLFCFPDRGAFLHEGSGAFFGVFSGEDKHGHQALDGVGSIEGKTSEH